MRDNLLQRDYELINELRTEYELCDGVINVLIYYTLEETQRLPRLYATKVAKSWIDNDITTTRLAVKILLKRHRNKVKFVSTMRKATSDCQEVLKVLDNLTSDDHETLESIETIKQRIESIISDLEIGSLWED